MPKAIRRLAGRIERRVYRRRAAQLPPGGHIEKIAGHHYFVPPGVLSPRLFRTGPLLARCAAGRVQRGTRLLDMGTGTGIVGIEAAHRGAQVCCVDVDGAAVQAARVNAMLNGVEIDVFRGDLFEPLPIDARFDLIAFNPPFFQRRQGGALERALSDGPGLPTFDRFLSEALDFLAPDGQVLIAASSTGALRLMRRLYRQHRYTHQTVATRERISERLIIDVLRPVAGGRS